jgi:adenine deaminase
MITINPAEQLGIDDKVGSIEEGKHGDVAIWSGHPLSIYSIAEKTFVDGKKYFDREEDPNDMRVKVDPEADYDEASRRWYEEGGRHGDSCLRGAEIRFSENGMEL